MGLPSQTTARKVEHTHRSNMYVRNEGISITNKL